MSKQPGIDVSSLVAIDVHVHLESTDDATATDAAAKKYFGESGASRDHRALAEYYRSRKIAFVVFAVDERLTGRRRVTNEEVIRFAAENSDAAIPFASIDPHRGSDGVREARELVAGGVIRGLKLHPPIQQFSPSDPVAYPLYEVFAEARLPVIFHTGHSGIGTGMPGGGGIRLKFGNPLPIDDVAVDFPSLPIIMAHPSFPWQDEAISICLHKPNVYIDLSGWSPKYFFANTHSIREFAVALQGSVRIRLSFYYSGPLAGGFRPNFNPRRSTASHRERKCRQAAATGRQPGLILSLKIDP